MVNAKSPSGIVNKDCEILRENNHQLAKALSDERLISRQYLEDLNFVRNKLNASQILNLRYENLVGQLYNIVKDLIPSFVNLSQDMPEMIRLCTEAKNILKDPDAVNDRNNLLISESASSLTNSSQKTHAVSPMVSGHVILRPTINLQRLNRCDSPFQTTLDDSNVSTTASSSINPLINNSEFGQNGDIFLPQRLTVFNNIYDLQECNNAGTPNLDNNDDIDNDEIDNDEIDDDCDCSNETCSSTPRLETIHEEPESASEIDTSVNLPKEVKVVLNPIIHLSSMITSRRKESNYDPLEGPSTLLDDTGCFRNQPYVHKPRAVQRVYKESDSDSDDDSRESSIKKSKKKAKKRKSSTSKTNANVNSEVKAKRAKKSNEKQKNAIDEAVISCPEEVKNENVDLENETQTTSYRPRRNICRKYYKEVNANSKIRRSK